MALDHSSLSRVCHGIADHVADAVHATTNAIRVTLGPPADAVPGQSDTEHRINLFFYRFEPSGLFGDVAPDEPWMIRLSCLITVFCVIEENIPAGESELRLLGQVLRLFHDAPVLTLAPVEAGGDPVNIQVIYQTMGLEEINHLWSTQGNVTYRPSLTYEMALAPVLPVRQHIGSPLVAMTGLDTRADMGARQAVFGGAAQTPDMPAREVNADREGWAPAICLVYQGACHQSLSLALGSGALAAFTPAVWVAGENGSEVSLEWEIWDSADGWRAAGDPTAATATGPVLDPAAAADAVTSVVALPFSDHAGQAVLYARRRYTRGSDGAQLTVRSNPVLVNLYGGG